MIKEAMAQLVKKEDLTAGQMNEVMEGIMTGEATEAPVCYTHLRAHENKANHVGSILLEKKKGGRKEEGEGGQT